MSTMKFNPNGLLSDFPKRAELPSIPGTPPGAAWFWGKDDERGRLNLLTPERLQQTTRENVRDGTVISMDLPLTFPSPPLFGRAAFEHKILKLGVGGYDETYLLNPQSGSQWDGFRHVAEPETLQFYNGVTIDEIDARKEDGSLASTRCGAGAWAKEGIVGRAVLLDVYGHLDEQIDAFTTRPITLKEVQSTAAAQGVEFRIGDILLIRTGWIAQYRAMSQEKREALANIKGVYDYEFAGLEQSPEMLDFLHDNYFAAAAADCIALEAWPPGKENVLHAHMLPRWGMPIGELFDLEGVVEKCHREGRWTFLLSAAPDAVPGSIGSKANALAIF
ncbi:hypothetical protein EJ06DRAFT_33873 [Trichodelitschia bisporula]|uniref:Cyclase n=1 Tax=Trichodelitschia bisporula TaxID=703511 RepID=A0A6G1HVA8_9PEZI|nr:hypothetical protein EJ06DRAFT_33873 [Trichodelitschia bisporula]